MVDRVNTKLIYISKDDSIHQIQDRFSELFPFLKISIFKHVDLTSRQIGENILFCLDIKMNQIDLGFQGGFVTIFENMTIAKLEQAFHDKWGLVVEISRKNSHSELDSASIDHYSLAHANQEETAMNFTGKEIIYFRDVPYGC